MRLIVPMADDSSLVHWHCPLPHAVIRSNLFPGYCNSSCNLRSGSSSKKVDSCPTLCSLAQGDLAGQLPGLLHQMWYAWHAARLDTSALAQLGARTGAGSDMGTSAPAIYEGAAQSALVALGLLADAQQASLSTRAAKALQLRLAARHVARWGFTVHLSQFNHGGHTSYCSALVAVAVTY